MGVACGSSRADTTIISMHASDCELFCVPSLSATGLRSEASDPVSGRSAETSPCTSSRLLRVDIQKPHQATKQKTDHTESSAELASDTSDIGVNTPQNLSCSSSFSSPKVQKQVCSTLPSQPYHSTCQEEPRQNEYASQRSMQASHATAEAESAQAAKELNVRHQAHPFTHAAVFGSVTQRWPACIMCFVTSGADRLQWQPRRLWVEHEPDGQLFLAQSLRWYANRVPLLLTYLHFATLACTLL